MNARAARLFDEYAQAHRTTGNRACHAAGIPLIVFSLILALATVRLGRGWTAAEPVAAAASAAELAVDFAPGVVFFLFAAACDGAARLILARLGTGATLAAAAGLFAIGWALQLAGHAVYEKNRPAFVRNLRHLLIGPLWIARKLL